MIRATCAVPGRTCLSAAVIGRSASADPGKMLLGLKWSSTMLSKGSPWLVLPPLDDYQVLVRRELGKREVPSVCLGMSVWIKTRAVAQGVGLDQLVAQLSFPPGPNHRLHRPPSHGIAPVDPSLLVPALPPHSLAAHLPCKVMAVYEGQTTMYRTLEAREGDSH